MDLYIKDTDDLLHGGGPEHLERMEDLKKRYKMGNYQFGNGRFCGKNYRAMPDGSILIDQEHFVQEKVTVIKIDSARRKQRYSKCNDQEISDLRALLGSLSSLSKESRPDLAGRTALLQQTLPHPRVRDLIEANLVAAEAYKRAHSGIKVSAIPISDLRVGVISDASWGNAKGEKVLETSLNDWWEEPSATWTRHHVDPRSTLFHPAASSDGPDLHDLMPTSTRTKTTLIAGLLPPECQLQPTRTGLARQCWRSNPMEASFPMTTSMSSFFRS